MLQLHVRIKGRLINEVLQQDKRVRVGDGLEERELDTTWLVTCGAFQPGKRESELFALTGLAGDAGNLANGHGNSLILHRVTSKLVGQGLHGQCDVIGWRERAIVASARVGSRASVVAPNVLPISGRPKAGLLHRLVGRPRVCTLVLP